MPDTTTAAPEAKRQRGYSLMEELIEYREGRDGVSATREWCRAYLQHPATSESERGMDDACRDYLSRTR